MIDQKRKKNDENLLYSTGNSSPCSVVTQMGRESKREGRHVYMGFPVVLTVKNPPASAGGIKRCGFNS